MKKLLSLLAILMITAVANGETLGIDDFTEGYTDVYNGTNYIRGYELDNNIGFHLLSSVEPTYTLLQDGGMTFSSGGISYLEVSANNGYRIKSVEIKFANADNSPKNTDNGYVDSKSTSGISISDDGIVATWTGDVSKWQMTFSTTTSSIKNLTITEVNVTYSERDWIDVSTAEEFYNAISNDYTALVHLTADIDLSELSFSQDEVFSGTFSGQLSGENKNGGADYTITSTGVSRGSMLFMKADGAIISHLTFNNFKWNNSSGEKIAIVARQSTNSTYENLTLKNCSIIPKGTDVDEVGGFVAISKHETFTNCTTSSDCHFEGKTSGSDINAGGIVGKAYDCTIKMCHNAAKIGYGYQLAGIVAYTEGCTIDRCLNTGCITGQQIVGGIVANAADATVIKRCVNTGSINLDGTKNYYIRGGIAGRLQDEGSCVIQCLNFGDVESRNDYGEIVGSRVNDATEWRVASNHCYYYCLYNGDYASNEDMYSDASIYRTGKILSGEFAYKSTIDEVEGADKWLYQDIDNGTFATTFPVPISTAGTVYSNILCDGTQSYSNKYQSTEAHESQLDANGVCTVCGAHVMHITDADGLVDFANNVNNGTDYSGYFVYLDKDINLSGRTDFTGIGGGDASTPFSGVFDGQGHRITNWTVTYNNVGYGHGFFRRVTGKNTVIRNLIIDSSCSITSTGETVATAGIVGFVTSTSGSCCNVTIENCGNEATITGYDNAAGILGGVYNNTSTYLTIANCYNTGEIDGTQHSATLCAIANCNHTFTNCYNSGSLTGVRDKDYFYRTEKGTSSVSNCYNVNHSQTGVTSITDDQVESGELCSLLNKNGTVFSQIVGTDTHPIPGNEGLTGATILHIANATELVQFAESVNEGTNYARYIIDLDDDIDLSGISFTGIGSSSYPFKGTFNGQGHSIKNWSVTSSEGYGLGFFRCVSGENTTIKNLIIDSSCSITSEGEHSGTAGLIGYVTSTSGSTCKVTIENCGNEATVTGYDNVAGILGGVYDNESTNLNIINCYNAGNINGQTNSAALCAIANCTHTFNNCYNSGSLTGVNGSYCLYRSEKGTSSVTNCYDINGSQTGVSKISQEDLRLGTLCDKLFKQVRHQITIGNGDDYSDWEQDLENNTHPILAHAAIGEVSYSRSMANQWGTIVLPFNVAISDQSPYDFYSISSVTDDALTLTKMTESSLYLNAGTPAIIQMSAAAKDSETGKYELSITSSSQCTGSTITNPDPVDGITLTGTYTTTDITDQDGYIISNNAFWNIAEIKGENKVYCDPFRAYLAGCVESGAKQLSINVSDEESTAVKALNAITEGTAEYYDMNGRRLNDLQKGINIVKFGNGTTKKIIIK